MERSSTKFSAALEASAFAALKSADLKRTKTRSAVICFLAQRHGPFTVDEIFRGVAKSPCTGPRAAKPCDLATIYRIIGKFEKAHLVCKTDFGDGVARIELASPDGHHHHHVICTSCGRAEPLRNCELKTQEAALLNQGYAQLTHRLEFFGLCPRCARKA